ncbi:MAG: ABC transporter substrate-binding protein, partial [Burkholderiales bacterium]
MSALGYVEGKNIRILWSGSAASVAQARAQAEVFLRDGVDIIVTGGTPAAKGALAATKTVPIIFLAGDPIGSGLAQSLARPGGNATGLAALAPELTAKRLEVLRDIVPKGNRFAMLADPSNPIYGTYKEAAQSAARTLGVRLEMHAAPTPSGLTQALAALVRSKPDGVLVSARIEFLPNRAEIAQAMRKARIPAIYPAR